MNAPGPEDGALCETPKHPDLIYDIGAHRGEDSEFYLRKGFRVVAIVGAEALEAGQRSVRFYKNDANPVWGTVRAEWAERNERLGALSVPIDVAAIDLADVIRTHGVPHYMKIDIEGMDRVCVRALARFRTRPDFVSLESDKTSFAAIAAEVGELHVLGFDAFQAVEQSAVTLQRPPSPAREGTYVAHTFEEGESGLFGAELPGVWRSRSAVLRQFGAIQLGYYLLGDDGVIHGWRWRGHGRLRRWTTRLLQRFTEGEVPGWHDVRARHSSVPASTR